MTTQKKMTVRVKIPVALAATKLGESDVTKATSASVKGPWIEIDLPAEQGVDGSVVVEKAPSLLIELGDVLSAFPEIVSNLGNAVITATYVSGTDLVFEGTETDFK